MTDEEFYAQVRGCGLKPTRTDTVWQTLDEQTVVYIQRPAGLDDDEKRAFLQELRQRTAGWRSK